MYIVNEDSRANQVGRFRQADWSQDSRTLLTLFYSKQGNFCRSFLPEPDPPYTQFFTTPNTIRRLLNLRYIFKTRSRRTRTSYLLLPFCYYIIYIKNISS